MWTITCDDGRKISEADFLWTNLPPDIRIQSLQAAGASLSGCSAYGFQRYDLSGVNGLILDHGLQLLGRRGDLVIVIDCHPRRGACVSVVPATEITYHQELWRRG
jgi:hypothetical protein